MNKLSLELLIQICEELSENDLLACQTVNSLLQAASTPTLYSQANIDDISAGLLLETLQKHSQLAPQIRSIVMKRHSAVCISRDIKMATRSLVPILILCKRLTALSIDWDDFAFTVENEQIAIDEALATGVYAAICDLPLIEQFKIVAPPGTIPIQHLLPALTAWAPRIQHLELSGIYESALIQEEIYGSPICMHELNFLSLRDSEVSDAHFKYLFGDMRKLSTVDISLVVDNSPSDHVLRQTIGQAASNLISLKIEKPWSGRQGGDYHLGMDLVSGCTEGHLKELSLRGEIYTSRLLKMPQMLSVETLELAWVSAIDHRDILNWLQGAEADKKVVKLESLVALFEGYEQDLDQDALDHLSTLLEQRNVSFEAAATLGSWHPPLASRERRAANGQLDA